MGRDWGGQLKFRPAERVESISGLQVFIFHAFVSKQPALG